MVRMMRKWALALVTLGLGVQTGLAQTPTLLPGSTPSAASAALYPAGNGLGRPTVATLEDTNGQVLRGDPLLDGPRAGNLGWFGSVDLDFLGPHVNNQLTGVVTAGLRTNTVALPSTDLHWAVSPRFEVGYRFDQAAGEVTLAYRFLNSYGSANVANFDDLGSPGALRSRLNMNVVDLDYGQQENSLLPGFEMKWRVGVRLATLFFDTEASSSLLEQHESNHFAGAGPHLSLELWRPFWNRQAGVFVKVEGAGVLGTVDQRFEETVANPIGVPAAGEIRQSQFMPTFTLSVQAGLDWTPTDAWRFTAGYTYEQWWDATFVNNSRGDVLLQGIFLRAEWKY
jgi:hypothetical protein